ncbi:MAG: MFS transporter [Streptosporangiales bacterium]
MTTSTVPAVGAEAAASATVPSRPRRLLPVLLMAPLLAQADATIANVATPAIRTGLGASGAAVELVIGGYMIAFAVLLITGARLGQTHGYKRLFILGVGVFGVASLVGGLAPDPALLVGARLVQGAGAALMFPQTLTGIQLNFSGARRARAIGWYAIALATGAVLGQVLGGVLVSADIAGTGWRPIFLVNVPICVAVVAAARRYLPTDERRQHSRLDLRGVALLSGGVLFVVVPLTVGRGAGWPAWTWLALAAAVPAFAVFLRAQQHTAAAGGNPLVNTRVLARPRIVLGLVAASVATGTYYALLFTLAQYIQAGLGRPALVSGLILVPWVAAFGAAGQVTRRLPARFGPHLPFAGYVLLTVAYLGIAGAVGTGHGPGAMVAVLLGIGGFGLGTGFATLLGHLTDTVPADYAPDISGVATTTMQVGGAVAVACFGSLYLALAGRSLPAGHALAVTSLVLGVAALVAAMAAYAATRAAK